MQRVKNHIHGVSFTEMITVIQFLGVSGLFLDVFQKVLILTKLGVVIQAVQNPVVVLLN